MPELSAQALRMAVVNAATTDTAFREQLLKEGASAVTARFGEQSLTVRVHAEDQKEMPVLVPHANPKLTRSIEHVVKNVGDRPPTRSEFEAILIHRAWNEPEFLAQLRSDAAAAVNGALQQYGSSVPEGVTVKLFEEKPGECLIVLPNQAADGSGELSDAELEAVAGGDISIGGIVLGAVVGAIASKVVDEIWEAQV